MRQKGAAAVCNVRRAGRAAITMARTLTLPACAHAGEPAGPPQGRTRERV